MSALGALLSPVPIYSEIRAQAIGWTSLASSQMCMHVQQAYCSDLLTDAAALEAAASMSLQDVVIRERHPGRRVRAWEKNCVAIGEAACVFDPLHFVDLHAVQMGLVHLLPLFPVQADFSVERDEYNQNVRAAFERMRDFQSAHYHLNRYGNRAALLVTRPRRGGERRARAQDRVPSARAARPVHYEDEAFTIDDWQSLFIGHGVHSGELGSGGGPHRARAARAANCAASWTSSGRRSKSSARTRTTCRQSAPRAIAAAPAHEPNSR